MYINAACITAQTGWESRIFEREFTKRLCHRLWAPNLWCDFLWTVKRRYPYRPKAWRKNKILFFPQILYVRSSNCLLYIQRWWWPFVLVPKSCIAQWYIGFVYDCSLLFFFYFFFLSPLCNLIYMYLIMIRK